MAENSEFSERNIDILSFVTASEFWVRYIELPRDLIELDDYMDKNPFTECSAVFPGKAGQIIALHHSAKRTWFRGEVKAMDPNTREGVKYDVFLMDEGRTIKLFGTDLHQLPPKFANHKPRAFLVKLDGVFLDGLSEEDIEKGRLFINTILNAFEFASMKIVKETETEIIAKLFITLTGGTKKLCLNEQITDLFDNLVVSDESNKPKNEVVDNVPSPPPNGIGRGHKILMSHKKKMDQTSPIKNEIQSPPSSTRGSPSLQSPISTQSPLSTQSTPSPQSSRCPFAKPGSSILGRGRRILEINGKKESQTSPKNHEKSGESDETSSPRSDTSSPLNGYHVGMGRGRKILEAHKGPIRMGSPNSVGSPSPPPAVNKEDRQVNRLRNLIEKAKNKRNNPPVVWSQTGTTINLKVMLTCSKNKGAMAAVDGEKFLFYFEGDKLYTLEVALFAKCKPEVNLEIKGLHIAITLTKDEEKSWLRLLEQKQRMHWLKYDLLALKNEESSDSDRSITREGFDPDRRRKLKAKSTKEVVIASELPDPENNKSTSSEDDSSDDDFRYLSKPGERLMRDYGIAREQ